MDAFYASVEQLDNPELRGKPVAVGGSRQRGVVAAASYEARKFGVRSAMSSMLAAKQCPQLIFVKPRFERYKEVSIQIREIFHAYTDLVEPLSLDEAFLDVTENKKNLSSASQVARLVREEIKAVTGLNASAGISVNKFMAKVASDINKPNGQKTIPPEEVLEFLERLPIGKFFGVGEKTAMKMRKQGIFTGAELKKQPLSTLNALFGKSGQHFYDIVRGISHSEVRPDRIRKSLGAERTFMNDLDSTEAMVEQLEYIADELDKRLSRGKVAGKTITLKLKYDDFTIHTRSKTISKFVSSRSEILVLARELLEQEPLERAVRLLGITLSKLNTEDESISVQLEFEF